MQKSAKTLRQCVEAANKCNLTLSHDQEDNRTETNMQKDNTTETKIQKDNRKETNIQHCGCTNYR